MCLIAIAWKTDADWPLVLVGNRDEFHARATDPASFWRGAPDVIGGRDLAAGGSWLGVRANGRFAAVTNYRDRIDPPPEARSRGHLVGDFLRGEMAPAVFMADVAAEADCYAGFNLFVGDRGTLMYFSNRGGQPRQLAPGRYALSNAALDTPWPKVQRMRDAFAQQLDEQPPPDPEALLAVLNDRTPAPDADLPDTGLPRDRERLLSAPFVVSPSYGTRASSVVIVRADGRTSFTERGFDPSGGILETRQFVFRVDPM
ncbi:MAG TPA: NRDE family protein [Gammaproteobacteria bacterium]|nr:NRDE family protein [Gammaproteobacteria bacterium]HET7587966.1 NRDE family protein [Gammaproteobacteria bacterium]